MNKEEIRRLVLEIPPTCPWCKFEAATAEKCLDYDPMAEGLYEGDLL